MNFKLWLELINYDDCCFYYDCNEIYMFDFMLLIYELVVNVMVFGVLLYFFFSVELVRLFVNDGVLYYYDVLVFIFFIIYGRFCKRVLISYVY